MGLKHQQALLPDQVPEHHLPKRLQGLHCGLLAGLAPERHRPKRQRASASASSLVKDLGYQYPKLPMASASELLSGLVMVFRLPKLETDQHLLFQLDQVPEHHLPKRQRELAFALLREAAMDWRHRNNPSDLVIELLRAMVLDHPQIKHQLALGCGSSQGLDLDRHLRRRR